jgi:hypothetical protein
VPKIFGFKIVALVEGMAVALFMILFFMWKSAYIAPQLIPEFDGSVYLVNAHAILTGQPLYIWSYPLLLSGIIALVWSVIGENYLPVRFFNLTFTLATAVVLYYSIRSEFGRIPSFLAAITYLTSIEILFYSDILHVHGLASLFAILALVTWRKHTYLGSVVGGVFAALGFLARYSLPAIVFPVFLAFAVTNRKRPKLIVAAILGACAPILVYHVAFPSVLPRLLDIYIGYGIDVAPVWKLPWYYYLANWYSFFGIIGVFGLVALFLPSTYRSDSSRPWAFWLIGAVVFFTITSAKTDRYVYEWTPAVVYLSFLCLIKIRDRLLVGSAESRLRLLSRRLPGSFNRVLFGTLMILLVLLQSCAFGSAYIQYERNFQPFIYQGPSPLNNNLLAVADYLRSHIPANATFITDCDAPQLSYFSGRKGFEIWEYTNATGYLDYLHDYMRSTGARDVLIFPSITGNSAKVLEGSDFLTLEDTLNVTAIGPVYVFHST